MMIRKIYILPLLTLMMTLSSCVIGNPKVLSPLCRVEAASGLRIPPGTMKMAGLFCGGKENEMIRNINCMEIVDLEGAEADTGLSSTVSDIAGKRKMTLLMSVSGCDESICFYGVLNKKGDTLKEILIETSEKKESAVIYIKGKINLADMMEENGDGNLGNTVTGNVRRLSKHFR